MKMNSSAGGCDAMVPKTMPETETAKRVRKLTNEPPRNEREYRANEETLIAKGKLNKAENGVTESNNLRCKLQEFAKGDRTMEMIFADVIGRIADTITSLSEELVNASEALYRSKAENKNLHRDIDRLNAMLRSKTGSAAEHCKRINELGNLAKQLKAQTKDLKNNLKSNSCLSSVDYLRTIRNIEKLLNNLKAKLKNDYEALVSGGDSSRLKCIKRIINLRVNFKEFCVELEKSSSQMRENSAVHCNEYLKTIFPLESSMNEISAEIDKLKAEAPSNCNNSRHLDKLVELEATVKELNNAASLLKRETTNTDDIMKLERLAVTLCDEIKELETIVAAEDNSLLPERITQLEDSVVELRTKLAAKEDTLSRLEEQYANAKMTLEQRTEVLESTERKLASLIEENRTMREESARKEHRILEFLHERADSAKRLAEMQRIKDEIEATRETLQDFRSGKDELLRETERMQAIVRERDNEILKLVSEKDLIESSLTMEIDRLKVRLQTVLDENVKLENRMNELNERNLRDLDKLLNDKEGGDVQRSQDLIQSSRTEIERLKIEADESKRNLDAASSRIANLKETLNQISIDRGRLEASIVTLTSSKEFLKYQMDILRTTIEKTSAEFRRRERDENEQLKAQLMLFAIEEKFLRTSLDDTKAKCSGLEDQINEYRIDRSSLQREISEFKAASEDLKLALEGTRKELESVRESAVILKSENSRLQENLNDVIVKNSETEDRVRVLLTEKNVLATRINELDELASEQRDQLNKAKGTCEYLSLELNRSRIERDKAASRNAFLQDLADEAVRGKEELRRTRDECELKCRLLDDQLRILQMRNSLLKRHSGALLRENDGLKGYLNKINVQLRAFREMDGDAAGSERSEGHSKSLRNDRAKIRDKPKDELKRLRSENEALKFELANLRTANAEARSELAWTKDEFERLRVELTRAEERAIGTPANKLEVVNVYYRREVNNYANQRHDGFRNRQFANVIDEAEERTLSLWEETNAATPQDPIEVIDKLRIENAALRLELNALHQKDGGDSEKGKNDLGKALEEIRALELELTRLRAEGRTLKSELDHARTEADRLKMEKVALKDELAILRRTNSDLRVKGNNLQNEYEKLRVLNVRLETRLNDALKYVSKYTLATERLDDFENKLRNVLEDYVLTKEALRLATAEIKQLKRETS